MTTGQMRRDPLTPFPWYQAMRSASPVVLDPNANTWQVFRYADVQRVLSDHEFFSSRMGGPDDSPISNSLIALDPPRHRQMRTLVTQAFTPRAVDNLAPRIQAITDELLDRIQSAGRFDAIHDLAVPLPVIVIAELLGIPSSDRAQFKEWSDEITSTNSVGTGQREMAAYFYRFVEERRREPRDDLVSALLQADVEGQRLSLSELLGFCVLLLVAGNETTTNLIGNALLCFCDDAPGMLDELTAQPQLLPAAIEEVLRFRSPVQCMFRVTTRATELDGHRMQPGQSALAWIGSANRDETVFEDPDAFDVRRSPNRHIAFGHGLHFCLGAPLARLEARIALGAMLARLRNLRRVPDVHLEAQDSFVVYGLKRLPMAFDAP
jgi:cytochrome P450